jgi:aminoglycoside N3'-acetyltransferase
MLEVTLDQAAACLQAVGIGPGDGLLVHSAIQYLGRPVGGAGLYLEAIRAVAGPDATVAVPTFNFGFAKGEPYDPLETPSVGMGAFSEYIRRLPEARRTLHPLQSLAVVGRWAADLAGRDTPCAFDPGSAFERMLELDFKLLLLGADWKATSMFHYSEQRAAVPYRYWKDFSGPLRRGGVWETRTYRMFVRDLEINPQLTLDPLIPYMQERGHFTACPLNYGQVIACRLADFVTDVDSFLARDPWAFVANRP